MKRIIRILTSLLVLLVFSGISTGGEGHSGTASTFDFRLGTAKVQFALQPVTYTKGKTPQVVISLSDFMSNSPVIDADIYVSIDKAAQASAHAGHVMPSAAPESSAEGGGLDFGEPNQTSAPVDVSAFTKLKPQQKAGVYTAEYPLAVPGDYSFTIAISSLAGKRYSEPLVYGGTLSYRAASKSRFYSMIFVFVVIVLSGLTGAWIIRQRSLLKLETGHKFNMLDIPSMRKFLKSGWFQPVFQVPVLVVFLIIIAAGLFDIQKGDRNIATILTWTIWWAAIIFTFVLVGRIWCMMCPFGAAQDWLGRLFSMNRDFPDIFRNIYLSSFLFFALTWWDSYSGIVNKPAMTSYLLVGFFVVAIGMALVYKGRSFCRYVCPIGGLIGLYSMFSPLELRSKCLDVCRGHKVKECIKGSDKGRPCPMFVTPMTLDRNNYCNFCSECIKSCSQDNIVVRFRSFARDLWVSSRGYLDEALLAMVLVGISIIVTGEMIEPWPRWIDALGEVLPFDLFGIESHAAREKATFLFVLTGGSLFISPLLLLSFSAIVRKTLPDTGFTVKQIFIQFAYMFIPVGLAMHLAHNISHLLKEGPGIIPALQRVINNITGAGEPDWVAGQLAGSETIFWLQMAVLITLNIFSLYAGYRIAVRHYGDRALKAFVPMALLAIFFMVINTYILGQPMALRHTH
ncbi:MAG: 4Fe-4S binding protein [Thermodesulfovibrionales bacterium]|nr:4Fe-4S binding protein [Thermodesulfovibrionales bacterium]